MNFGEGIKKLKESNYNFIIYNYIKEKENLEEQFIEEYRNDNGNKQIEQNLEIDCFNCLYNHEVKIRKAVKDMRKKRKRNAKRRSKSKR